MKFSEMMYFKMTLKVTKNQGCTLSLKDTIFEKPQGGQIDPAGRFKVKSCRIIDIVNFTLVGST